MRKKQTEGFNIGSTTCKDLKGGWPGSENMRKMTLYASYLYPIATVAGRCTRAGGLGKIVRNGYFLYFLRIFSVVTILNYFGCFTAIDRGL